MQRHAACRARAAGSRAVARACRNRRSPSRLVYSAPVVVRDAHVKTVGALAALSGMSSPRRGVRLTSRDEHAGCHLRLARDGKRLRVEFDTPENLGGPDLATLRKDVGGQIAVQFGDGAFDFLADAVGLSIVLAAGEGVLKQFPGDAWRLGRPLALRRLEILDDDLARVGVITPCAR